MFAQKRKWDYQSCSRVSWLFKTFNFLNSQVGFRDKIATGKICNLEPSKFLYRMFDRKSFVNLGIFERTTEIFLLKFNRKISVQKLNSRLEFSNDTFRKIKLQLLKCAKMKASKIRPNPKIDLLEKKVQKEFRESQIKNAKSN